jgi:hypothetical protein
MRKLLVPGLLSGVAMLVVGMLLNRVYYLVVPSLAQEYENSVMFRPWSDPLMMLFFLYPFILGFVLAFLWSKKATANKPLKFALFYWLIASVPGMFVTYTNFVVSLAMIVSWSLNGFIQTLVAGFVFSKLKL